MYRGGPVNQAKKPCPAQAGEGHWEVVDQQLVPWCLLLERMAMKMDDDRVNQLVQQWLNERGYQVALLSLQQESGVKVEDIAAGGQLCSMLYEFAELKAMLEPVSTDPLEAERKAAEADLLATEDRSVEIPLVAGKVYANIHAANIISARFSPDGALIATGSTDRTVKVVDAATGGSVRTVTVHAAPVLSVGFCPADSSLLLSTAMDGSTILSSVSDGAEVLVVKDHAKYVAHAVWSVDGHAFATAGHDRKVNVYRRAAGVENGAFGKVLERDFVAIPEAICFLDDCVTLVIAVREDNYFHYVDTSDPKADDLKVNQNQLGDDHVSFTVLDLVVSPNGKYLLASTDKSRLILYLVGTSIQLRSFYGAVNDDLCQTRACFHPSGAFVYVTSQDNKVYGWRIRDQKVVARLTGHAAVVRDIDISKDGKTLISASFDKTIRAWTPS